MSIYRRGDIWWLYLVHNGRRIRESTEKSDRKDAQRVHDEFRAELWKVKQGSGTLYGALDTWAKEAGESDICRVAKFKRLHKNVPLATLTAKSIEGAIPATTAGTFNRYVNAITAALNKAGHPVKLKRKKNPAGRVRWITRAEWARLYKQLSEHLKPVALFSIETGLRQANVLNLEWSQVDLARKVAWIHPDQAKADKAIGIPLSDVAVKVLGAQRDAHERWVFPYRGEPMARIKASRPTEKSNGGAFQRAVKRAKLANFTWHDLRHTWASWHVQNGTPLPVLRELGGWATMQMVMRYAHLAPEHLRAYANNTKVRHKTTPQKRVTN